MKVPECISLIFKETYIELKNVSIFCYQFLKINMFVLLMQWFQIMKKYYTFWFQMTRCESM